MSTDVTTDAIVAEGKPHAVGQRAGRPVRLLVVSSDSFPPTRVDVAVLFGEELARRGHKVDWILQSEADCRKAYRTPWGGGEVYVGPTDLGGSLFNRIRKHTRGILQDLRVFTLARHDRYDLIEVKDKFLSGIFAMIAARVHGIPLIYWLSFPFPESYLERARDGTARYPFLYLIRGWVFKVTLYRLLLPAAAHVFVQSEQMRVEMGARGVPLHKMTAVPMGVKSISPLTSTPAANHVIPAGERCVLYLGTIVRARRIDFLVRVIAKVRARIPAAVLYLVGAGDDPRDEETLLQEARRLQVTDGIKLVGQLPQALAFQYVRAAQVCLSPFYPSPILNVASPTKLVEYMAMGKAVVANDHPEQRRILQASGAGLCVAWDETAWAEAIIRLLNEPQTAAAMGELGRRFVARYRTYDSIADIVEEQLRRLLGHAGAPANGS